MQRLLELIRYVLLDALGPVMAQPTVVNSAALGTTPVKALAAAAEPVGRIRRCKLVACTADENIAWTIVEKDATAPTITAAGDGTSTDGVLIVSAQKLEYVAVPDDHDLYVVGSTSPMAYQLSYVEQ